jgi:hypothetical protein
MNTDARKTLGAIQALIMKDLEATSDEELRAELVEDGQDPDILDREIAERLDSVVSEFLRNRVAATKAVKKTTQSPVAASRPALEKIKDLVRRTFEIEPSLATAFRNGTKQSDNDWISTYDDLVLLGKIEPNKDD